MCRSLKPTARSNCIHSVVNVSLSRSFYLSISLYLALFISISLSLSLFFYLFFSLFSVFFFCISIDAMRCTVAPCIYCSVLHMTSDNKIESTQEQKIATHTHIDEQTETQAHSLRKTTSCENVQFDVGRLCQ